MADEKKKSAPRKEKEAKPEAESAEKPAAKPAGEKPAAARDKAAKKAAPTGEAPAAAELQVKHPNRRARRRLFPRRAPPNFSGLVDGLASPTPTARSRPLPSAPWPSCSTPSSLPGAGPTRPNGDNGHGPGAASGRRRSATLPVCRSQADWARSKRPQTQPQRGRNGFQSPARHPDDPPDRPCGSSQGRRARTLRPSRTAPQHQDDAGRLGRSPGTRRPTLHPGARGPITGREPVTPGLRVAVYLGIGANSGLLWCAFRT